MADRKPDPERSELLVQRAKAGDRDAFDALIRSSQDRLARLVRARLGSWLKSNEESADVVQSVLREAVAALPDFEYRGEGSFLRWLGTIVEHKLAHRARDLQREKRRADRVVPLEGEGSTLAVEGHEPSPSAVAAEHELDARYRDALAQLADPDREVLLLSLELGCSHDEIARALSIVSAEAVRKRVARALARLQALMRPPV